MTASNLPVYLGADLAPSPYGKCFLHTLHNLCRKVAPFVPPILICIKIGE